MWCYEIDTASEDLIERLPAGVILNKANT